MSWPLPLRGSRHHLGQAVMLAALSVFAIAACAAGPLYERAVQQASLRSALTGGAASERSLTIHAGSAPAAAALTPAGDDRRFFGPPVTGAQVEATVTFPARRFATTLIWRTSECAHLRFVGGGCPSDPMDVAISSSSATALGLRVGQIAQLQGTQDRRAFPVGKIRVAGLYEPFDGADDYWLNRAYSSKAGVYVQQDSGTGAPRLRSDAVFASQELLSDFQGASAAATLDGKGTVDYYTELPIAVDRVGVDDITALRKVLARATAAVLQPSPTSRLAAGTLETGLGSLLDAALVGRDQARLVIPALAIQLALISLLVLGVVMVAAVDERQPEFGLARLRGRSRRGAATMFASEVGTLAVLSAIPALALAWLACELSCRWWLPRGVHAEIRAPVLLAAAAVVLAELLFVVAVARRAASQPIQEMLRTAPRRPSARRITVAEVAIAVASLAGLVVALSGARRNAVAAVTPTTVALLAGMLVSRAAVPLAQVVGAIALRRGRLVTALCALQIARRADFRRVLMTVVLAAAFVAAAGDEWSVSGVNRTVRAGAAVGADVVLHVRASSPVALTDAVAKADPSGRYATPVVTQEQPGGTAPVMAVDPSSFAAIARWGWPRDRPAEDYLRRLASSRFAPAIRLPGGALRLKLDDTRIDTQADPGVGSPGPVSVRLVAQRADASTTSVDLRLPAAGANLTVSGSLASCASGCTLRQIQILREASDHRTLHIHAVLSLSAGGSAGLVAVPLGAAGDWLDLRAALEQTAPPESLSVPSAPAGGLDLDAVNVGEDQTLQHLDAPVPLAAIIAGAPPSATEHLVSTLGIDGQSTAYRPIGTLPLAPGSRGVLLTDLNTAIRASSPTQRPSELSVWLGRDDPSSERALVADLVRHGVTVATRESAADRRAVLAASAPAWSMQLALVTAALVALMAVLMLVAVALSSRAVRGSDLASLRLVGVRRSTVRRGVVAEQLLAVVLGVVVGAAVGMLGAHLALPGVPMFVTAQDLPAIRFPTPWITLVVASVGTLAVLLVAGLAVALAAAGASDASNSKRGGQ